MNGSNVCKHAGRTRWIFENDGKYPLLSQRRQGIFCATASNFGVNTNLRRRMCAPFPMLVYFSLGRRKIYLKNFERTR